MLSIHDYKNQLMVIGPKFKNPNIQWGQWYKQYEYYEKMWETYFDNIFLENFTRSKNECIKFIFWESCPGGMPFPHQNYAFDNNRYLNIIHGTFDSYLKTVCVQFDIKWNGQQIGTLLENLSKKGILIIDIYPTHGISLDKTNRIKLYDKLFLNYSIVKLKIIGEKIRDFCKESNIYTSSELANYGIKGDMVEQRKNEIKEALQLLSSPIFSVLN